MNFRVRTFWEGNHCTLESQPRFVVCCAMQRWSALKWEINRCNSRLNGLIARTIVTQDSRKVYISPDFRVSGLSIEVLGKGHQPRRFCYYVPITVIKGDACSQAGVNTATVYSCNKLAGSIQKEQSLVLHSAQSSFSSQITHQLCFQTQAFAALC